MEHKKPWKETSFSHKEILHKLSYSEAIANPQDTRQIAEKDSITSTRLSLRVSKSQISHIHTEIALARWPVHLSPS